MAYDEDIEDNQNNTSITWDARQGRSKLILNLVVIMYNAYNNEDYQTWFKQLQAIHWTCFPFAKSEAAKKVKQKLQQTKNWVNLNDRSIDRAVVIKHLEETTELIMETYKDQFMQVNKEENTEFNLEEALGR